MNKLDTNLLHRYIKLPFVLEKPKEFLINRDDNDVISIPKSSISADFNNWISKYGLDYFPLLEGFYTAPHNKLPIHSDIVSKNQTQFTYSNICKINFTWGSEESTTRWWVPTDPELVESFEKDSKYSKMQLTPNVTDEHDPPHIFLKESRCKMIFEKTIDRPSLLNVGQLHSTYNPTDHPRWTLSIMPMKPDGTCVNFDEALEFFEDVIDE